MPDNPVKAVPYGLVTAGLGNYVSPDTGFHNHSTVFKETVFKDSYPPFSGVAWAGRAVTIAETPDVQRPDRVRA